MSAADGAAEDLKAKMEKLKEELDTTETPVFTEEQKTRAADALVVTLFHVETLIDRGFLSGKRLLTDIGRERARKLVDAGFECTDEEVHAIMSWLMPR